MTQEDIDASEAPLIDHLIELRTRLIYCIIGFLAAFIFSFIFSSDILRWLVLPFKWGTGEDVSLISIKLLGVFLVKLKIAFFGVCSSVFR
jgi:sec-independent protein translocase protein TatC